MLELLTIEIIEMRIVNHLIIHNERSLEMVVITWILRIIYLGIPVKVLSNIWKGLLLENVCCVYIHLILLDGIWTIFIYLLNVIGFNQGFAFP
jgi:hypothetical protein